MNIATKHYYNVDERNIHIFRTLTDFDKATKVASEASRQYQYHLAILDGQGIANQASLLPALANAYDFPKYYGQNYERLSWDAAEDWLSDLTWLTDGIGVEQSVKGFLLLYSYPATLFAASALDFAIFIDTFSSCARKFGLQGYPCHMLIGPVDYPTEMFLNLLKVADFICSSGE